MKKIFKFIDFFGKNSVKNGLFYKLSVLSGIALFSQMNICKKKLKFEESKYKNTLDSEFISGKEKSLLQASIEESSMLILSGSNSTELSKQICAFLDVMICRTSITNKNEEMKIKILDSVRGKHVFYIQSLGPPVNDNLMELLFTISALKRSSARKITVIIPYFAYARHFKNFEDKVFPSSEIASLLQCMGANTLITVNFPSQIDCKGFFNFPVIDIDASILCAEYLKKKKNFNDLIVISNDIKKNNIDQATNMIDNLRMFNINSLLGCLVKDNSRKYFLKMFF